jgi:hypothetical protein
MRDKLVTLGTIPQTNLAKAIDPELRMQALERIGK